MQSFLHGLGELIMPILKESRFKETGVLTPEEFVQAGDYLVFKCPTWQWAGGLASKQRSYLPADKQYLITRNVPCVQRVRDMEANVNELDDVWDDLEVVDTKNNDSDDIKEITEDIQEIVVNDQTESNKKRSEDEDEIPDMEEFEDEENLEVDDPAALKPSKINAGSYDNLEKTRTYDAYITYDKYYQTPRMWLFGYNEDARPLTPDEIFSDISQDHAKKTVTIETHPHLDISLVSIHPCRHGSVMKKIIERMDEGKDSAAAVRVDQYLMVFLKFMSCVVPTINYDHTMSV